jgi:hypothetical protein
MSLFYKRTELAGRLGAFFAAGSIANGFTGLIAYGVWFFHPIFCSVVDV